MTGARTNTLASLRGSIERIEAHADAAQVRVALGHADADATLQGGLALAAMHEVFAEGRQSAAATGFIAGLAGRAAARRPLVWIRQDFAEIESGALSMAGLAELGLDPRRVVTVRAADVDVALRTAADALACDAVGAVVLEVWGEPRQRAAYHLHQRGFAAEQMGATGNVEKQPMRGVQRHQRGEAVAPEGDIAQRPGVGGCIGIEHPQLRTDGAGIGERQADRKTQMRGGVIECENLQRVVLLRDDDAGLVITRRGAAVRALDAVDGQARQPQAEDTPPVSRKGTHHISIP